MQFNTGDWLKDPRLSMCLPATRGIWIDAIAAMHECGRSGALSGSPEQLSRVLRCTESALMAAIDDLQATGAADVTSRNGIITLNNRRMQREDKERQGNRLRQDRYRKKKDDNGDNNADITPLYDSDSSSPLSEKKKGSGGKEKPPPAPSTDLFHSFWIEYPRHENPRKAREAFAKAGIDPDLLESIIAWLAEARKSEQWQDKTKIPHPTTFLNQRRWEGDPPPPPAEKQATRDTVGLADASRPQDPDVCEHCAGTGRVLVVTGDGQVLGRAPWSAARQIHLAGPGEKTHTFRCSCPAGRKHMHLEPEPMEDIA
jgi:hypothetical protein